MALSLRPYPPPLELNGRRNIFPSEVKKKYFFLNARTHTSIPPPLSSLNGMVLKERTFMHLPHVRWEATVFVYGSGNIFRYFPHSWVKYGLEYAILYSSLLFLPPSPIIDLYLRHCILFICKEWQAALRSLSDR